MNENGEYFVEVCGINNLVMGGILFLYKEIQLLVLFGEIDKN